MSKPKACLTCHFYKYETDKKCQNIDSFFIGQEKEEGDLCNMHEQATFWRFFTMTDDEIKQRIMV